MAVYKLFPIKDATIYSGYPAMNTGLDELLEITNEFPETLSPSPRVARALVQFDQDEIVDVIDNKASTGAFRADFRSYISIAQGIDIDSKVEIYPISGSWNNGTGKYLDSPQTINGCSWVFQTVSGSKKWGVTDVVPYVTSSFTAGNSMAHMGRSKKKRANTPSGDMAYTQKVNEQSDEEEIDPELLGSDQTIEPDVDKMSQMLDSRINTAEEWLELYHILMHKSQDIRGLNINVLKGLLIQTSKDL